MSTGDENDARYPSPDALLAAYQTMRLAGSAAYDDKGAPEKARQAGYELAVEAHHRIALFTSWMSDGKDAYHVAWEKMTSGEDDG